MAEIFADVVANIRADSTSLRAELLASEQAVTKSSKIIQTQLDSIVPRNRDLFGRFMVGRINMGSLLAADADFANKATAKLQRTSVAARESVQALQGSLFLLTGQTGFFAVEMLRAVTHVGKLTTASGGIVAALSAAGTSAVAFVSKLHPVALAIAGLTAAYFALRGASASVDEKNKEFLKTLKDLREETERLGASESELRKIRERNVRQALPFGGAMPGGQVNPAMMEYAKAEDALAARKERLVENDFIRALNARRFDDAVRAAQRFDRTTGATFGVRAQGFIGNAPVGIFGEQREAKETANNTKRSAELLAQILRKLNPLDPSLSMGP